MKLQVRLAIVVTVVLSFLSVVVADQPAASFPKRRVLKQSERTSAEFAQIVRSICNPATAPVQDNQLKSSAYFFRTTERRFVFKDGRFNKKATLGGKEFVFLTVPEGAYGRSLYQIYANTGYDALSILKQEGKDMVGLVFRYPRKIKLSKTRSGELDPDCFASRVYVPTWQNAFSLFEHLAGARKSKSKGYWYLKGLSGKERDFIRFFQPERKRRVSRLPYDLLRVAGGPDWQYRQLLETHLSMNPHFRGTGITENTLFPASSRKGYPEFVGPNRKLSELAEFAVIDLGKMVIQEVHSP